MLKVSVLFCLSLLAIGLQTADASKKKEEHAKRLGRLGNRQQELQQKEKQTQMNRNMQAENRIVGGIQTVPGKYPFFVRMDGCGASLIHEDIILSAAHCYSVPGQTVSVGAYKLGSDFADAEERTILDRSIHPDYDGFESVYDIMVLKLDEPSTKEPVSLNFNSSIPLDGDSVTSIGFGALDEQSGQTSFLREVEIFTIPHDICNGPEFYDGDVDEASMICASIPEVGGKGSCYGDSGGPLINANGIQVGIVSWGNDCVDKIFPDVYARVSGATQWIQQQICMMASNPPEYCDDLIQPPPVLGPPPEGTVAVQLSVRFDDFPEEIGITIQNLNSGEMIVDYSIGAFENVFLFHTELLYLVPGQYEVTLLDSYGDGLCCEFGDGGVQIATILEVGEIDEVLVEFDGVFSYDTSFSFTVPGTVPGVSSDVPSAPTPSETTDPPAMTPTCQDKTGTITINDTIGEQDCSFLAQNIDDYGYLCVFLRVAAQCPYTCNACEYFPVCGNII